MPDRAPREGFWRESLALALPIALQNLLVAVSPLLDGSLITMTAGDGSPLAAIGMASQWTWLHGLMQVGFASGAGVFVSQYWGARDLRGIRRAYGLSMTLALAASLLFTAVGLLAPSLVMAAFPCEPDVAAMGAGYLRVACLAYPATAVYGVLVVVLRSTEQPRLPMAVSAVGVAAGAALSVALIYFGRMGVAGAGLSAALAAWVPPILLLALSLRRRNVLIEPLKTLLGWDRAFVRHYAAVSTPVLLNELLWAIGIVLCRRVFAADASFYAALTAYGAVEGVVSSVFTGICGACGVMVGKRVGMGSAPRARAVARRFAILMPAAAALVGVAMILFQDAVLWPFRDLDAAAHAMARSIIWVAGLELALRNFPFVAIV
ncbi:MAG: MATE family efflux transporter, partial [Clostridiales bacterium]|nr:MATE family efflux transporter [Clostridiales bacterium]